MRKKSTYILPPLENKKIIAIEKQVQKDISEQHLAMEFVRSEMNSIVSLKYQAQIKSFSHSRLNRMHASQSLHQPIIHQPPKFEQSQPSFEFLSTIRKRFLKSSIEPENVELLQKVSSILTIKWYRCYINIFLFIQIESVIRNILAIIFKYQFVTNQNISTQIIIFLQNLLYQDEEYFELKEYFKKNPVDQFIQGLTLLYRAVKDENVKMIQFLLSKGANMHLIQEKWPYRQMSPYLLAKSINNQEIKNLLHI